jgi:CBS domain-containing protein
MKVVEIMSKEVKSLSPDMTAREAFDIISGMEISGLPVIDKDGKLVGMFTEKDVLSHILPSYIEKVGRFVYEQNPKSTKKKITELGNIKVSQIMRKEVLKVNEDTTLCEVGRIMLTEKARRLPVVNKDGIVVGIVARCDILKAMAKESEI